MSEQNSGPTGWADDEHASFSKGEVIRAFQKTINPPFETRRAIEHGMHVDPNEVLPAEEAVRFVHETQERVSRLLLHDQTSVFQHDGHESVRSLHLTRFDHPERFEGIDTMLEEVHVSTSYVGTSDDPDALELTLELVANDAKHYIFELLGDSIRVTSHEVDVEGRKQNQKTYPFMRIAEQRIEEMLRALETTIEVNPVLDEAAEHIDSQSNQT